MPPTFKVEFLYLIWKQSKFVFNDYFVEQCSVVDTSSTLPAFRPRCPISLQSVDVDREKQLDIIPSLDARKALKCDDVLNSMIKICDNTIEKPLFLILEKCQK